MEGQVRGGGGNAVQRRLAAAGGDNRNRRCGLCRGEGHNRTTCHLASQQYLVEPENVPLN